MTDEDDQMLIGEIKLNQKRSSLFTLFISILVLTAIIWATVYYLSKFSEGLKGFCNLTHC